MPGSAVAVREPTALDLIRSKLDESRTSIEQVLVGGLDFDRLKGVAIEAITRQPKLLQCTVPSVIRAIHQSAQLGLEPSGLLGSAYLVPYRNKRSGKLEAQLIVGYRGLIELADRTAGIQVEADVVYPEDHFVYRKGSDPDVEHVPALDADRVDDKKITHVYAIAFHRDWPKPKVVVMTRAQVERIQKRAQRGADSPWHTDWAAMARKTPIRQLGNQMPLRVQRLFERVFTEEERVEQYALPATAPERATRTAQVRERLAERTRSRKRSPDEGRGTPAPAEGSAAGAAAPEASPAGVSPSGGPGKASGNPSPEADSDEPVAADFTVTEVDEVIEGSAADSGPGFDWSDR